MGSYARTSASYGTIDKTNITIGLGEQDYSNLYKNLINSLSNAGSFSNVDEADTNLNPQKDDLIMRLNFGPSGMNAGVAGINFTCVFNCLISIQNSEKVEIVHKDLNVTKKSYVSVGDAKNKAIKAFIEEVAGLLSSIRP